MDKLHEEMRQARQQAALRLLREARQLSDPIAEKPKIAHRGGTGGSGGARAGKRSTVRTLILALLLTGCSMEHVKFWDPSRTLETSWGYLEGNLGQRWQTDPSEGLRCVADALDLDVSLNGSVVVTDDAHTFREYYEAWWPLGDPSEYAAAFAWYPVTRGRQTLAPGADWIIVVYEPSVGDRSPLLVLAHELLHVAGYAHEDEPFEVLSYVVGLCEIAR